MKKKKKKKDLLKVETMFKTMLSYLLFQKTQKVKTLSCKDSKRKNNGFIKLCCLPP